MKSRTAPVQDSIADSFFVVPPSAAASTSNGPRLARTTTTPASTSTRTTGKTAEELALENDSLKTALDALARQYEHIVHERAAEKEALKGSIVVFGQEVRREAERAVAAQGKPVNPPSRPTNGGALAYLPLVAEDDVANALA